MSDIANKDAAGRLLSALSEQLTAAGQQAARDRVARDFSLPADWLNPGPTDLLEFGLPEGFIARVERRDYGDSLTVYFEELLAAARWSRSHDPSQGYAQVLREVLTHMGVTDADLGD